MPEACLIAPDSGFVGRVLAEGGGDLKKCFQCATCSVVCDLATGRKPFPRKEMIWAQWGLKDRLVADPDIWLCHQCNDCSTHCPRGARPADVLSALRQESIRHHALPRFLGTWTNGVKSLPLMLIISAVLIAVALLLQDPLNSLMGYEGHHAEPSVAAIGDGVYQVNQVTGHDAAAAIEAAGTEKVFHLYAEFFNHWWLIVFFSSFTTLAFLGAVVGALRFWKGMRAADEAAGGFNSAVGLLPAIVRAVTSIVVHDKFGKCTSQKPRRLAHLGAFYGFIALFVVTVWAVIDIYVMPLVGVDSLYPFALMHPMKILANVGFVLLLVGCVKAIVDRRAALNGDGPASTSFDMIFVWLLLLVTLTGFVTQVFRFAVGNNDQSGLIPTAHVLYFIHLVLVFQLLVYLPYSKFAHVIYRTVAMVYAERTGRNEPEMVSA
ncbi:MAG: quinone-interacting membrane-bound oxidoreductase complex subunit QmoC [Planctomycetota bacterium]|jgi:quinone-modifying oxidoreductase subunit QmoC